MIYTEKSLFLTENETHLLNSSLSKLFGDIGDYISLINDTTNIYLTGSLARGEPAVMIYNGVVKLKSDIDFVLVNKFSRDNNKFKCITDDLNQTFPGYQISCVVINEKTLPTLQSFFARDLALTFDKAVYQQFSIVSPPAYLITRENYIESIATQLACYMLHPNFTEDKSGNSFFREVDYHWIKSILECLRLPFFQREIIAYHDVVINNYIDEIRDIISSDTVKLIMKSRELSTPCLIERNNIYSIVYKLLAFSYHVRTEDELINKLANQKLNKYTSFQYSVIALFLFNYRKNQAWLSSFKKLITNIDFVNPTDILNLKRKTEEYQLNLVPINFEKILVLFREIRNKYVEILHKRNTRENRFTDLGVK